MSGLPEIWQMAVMASCLGISFLLSGMEAGVFALSRLRIRQLMRHGSSSARILNGYLENSEDFLWAILIGNNLANFAAICLLVAWLQDGMGAWHPLAWCVFVVAAFLFYALFDLLPKMLFHRFPNRLCLSLARPFRGVQVLLVPLVKTAAWVARGLLKWGGGSAFTGKLFGNREELRQLMSQSGHALTTEEQSMVQRVLDLQHRTAGQVMIPIEHALDAMLDEPLRGVLERARTRTFGSAPVWKIEGSRKTIAGILPLRRLLYEQELDLSRPVSAFIQPAMWVEDSAELDEVLRTMQKSGRKMVLVRGRDGEASGLIVLSDVLKSIFGEVSL